MKIVRKFIIAILFAILAIISCNSNEVYARSSSLGEVWKISEADFVDYSNDIYCVANQKHFGSVAPGETSYERHNYKFEFEVTAVAKIKGDLVTFSTKAGGSARTNHENNKILAAILGGGLERGYGGLYTCSESQLALHTFWNEWVESVGADRYGFHTYGMNDAIAAHHLVEKAKQYMSDDLEVTLYWLTPIGEAHNRNVQELILVDAPEPDEPEPEPQTPGKTVVNSQVNISGFVWEDIADNKSNTINNSYDSGETKLEGILVQWIDSAGGIIAEDTTEADGSYSMSTSFELWNHPYSIKDQTRYDQINNSYVQFIYNGLKYTTVVADGNLADSTTSKAVENESSRDALDNKFNRVENETVYDANGGVVLSNLPTKVEDNYVAEFSASASTGRRVTKLLDLAKHYNWIGTTTFCSSHCTAEGKHLACIHSKTIKIYSASAEQWEFREYTAEEGVIVTPATKANPNWQELYDTYTSDPNKEAVQMTDGYSSSDVSVKTYCNGEVEIESDGGQKYIDAYLEEYGYPHGNPGTLKGNQFNAERTHSGTCYYYDATGNGCAGETSTTTKDCLSSTQGIWQWNIYNMNLGLAKREQPDAALVSDIEQVRVVMKGQEYKYIYGNKGINDIDALIDYKVKFENKYVEQVYSRPVNPADIAYVNDNNTNDLNVYVTYNIKAKNQSTTLSMTINKVVNYYDDDYTIYTEKGTLTSPGWTTSEETINGYKIAYGTALGNKRLAPGEESDVGKIEFKVKQETVKKLLNENALLDNISEIYSYTSWYGEDTMYAERETAKVRSRVGHIYAGIDKDSTPGNAVPFENTDEYNAYKNNKEDDTDKAPIFQLLKDPKYKIVTGTVWEDQDKDTADDQRLGNGKKGSAEKGVQNVKVELLEVDNNGNIVHDATTGKPKVAKLFRIATGADGKCYVEAIDAVTYTDANGNYAFGNNTDDVTKRIGIAVDEYVIRYTYGNADKGKAYASGFVNATANEATKQTIKGTTLDGGNTTINARNYKSTVITNDHMKQIISGQKVNEKWHLEMNENATISIAVDDLNERLSIPELKYSTYNLGVNMSAYSKPVKIQVEYEDKAEQKMVENDDNVIDGKTYEAGEGKKDIFEQEIGVFDFGIVERAREDIQIDKTISKIKLVLANEQKLIDGDPRAQTLEHTKALGIREVPKFSTLDKLLTIELDSEIIQGSRLEVWYEITVANNSEIEYEYEADYSKIAETNYITEKPEAEYYYYGIFKDGQTEVMRKTIELVADYMSAELDCKVGADSQPILGEKAYDNDKWYKYDAGTDNTIVPTSETLEPISIDRLKAKGYISDKVAKALKDGKYQVLVTDTFKDIGPGETKSSTLYASRLLANKDEEGSSDYSYDNHVEVIQINSKLSRTIDSVDNKTREQIIKQYMPGNYIPAQSRQYPEYTGVMYTVTTKVDGTAVEDKQYQVVDGRKDDKAGLHYQDDDRVRIIITPPTGTKTQEYVTPKYWIVAAIGLVIITAGIIFIKKITKKK